MPLISRFLGISIYINSRDHNPPHLHIRFGGEDVMFDIKSLTIMQGTLPTGLRERVTQWATLHQEELLQNWETIREDGSFSKIAPLE